MLYRFVTILGQNNNLSLNQLYDKLKLHFANKTKLNLRKHHDWYRLFLQHISTNKRMKSQIRARTKLLTKRAKSEELIENGLKRLNLQEKSEKKLFKSKLTDLHQKMEEIHQIRNDQTIQQQLIQEKQRKQNRIKEMEEQTKWNEYRNEQKGRLNEYYKDKVTMLEMEKIQQDLQREEEQIKQRELRKINKKRVEYRENKRNEKVELQKQQISKCEQEEIEKEERLYKLRLKVKENLDEENINNISGVLNKTKNMINRLNNNSLHDSYSDGVVNMYPNYGYSDDKLFKDPKFVLMNRLISSNLHKSKYAKQCLDQTNGVMKPRKDCNHSDIF